MARAGLVVGFLFALGTQAGAADLRDYEAALRQAASGDRAGAIRALERIGEDTGDRRFLSLLVDLRNEARQPEEAERFLEAAIAAHPERAGPRLALAEMIVGRRPAEALSHAEAALAIDPDSPAAWATVIRLAKLTPAALGSRPGFQRASEATRRFAEGVAHDAAGVAGPSIDALRRAFDLRPGDWDISDTLYRVHVAAGQGSANRSLLDIVLRDVVGRGDAERIAITRGRLGDLRLNLNQFQAAIPLLTASADALSEFGLRGAAQARRQSLAMAHYYLGQYDDATVHADRAWREARENGQKRNEGRALGVLATVSYQRGDLGRAADHFERALAVAREVRDQGSEADLTASLAEVYGAVGQHGLALRMARSAVAEARKQDKRWLEGRLLLTLGAAAAQSRSFAEAQSVYRDAAKLAHANGDTFAEADVLARQGDVFGELGQWTAARDVYRQALALAGSIHSGAQELRARVGLGRSAARLGDSKEALGQFEEALRLSDAVGSLTHAAAALTGLAQARQTAGDIPAAADAYLRAIEKIEGVRLSVGAPDEQAAFLATQMDAYRGLVDCLLGPAANRTAALDEAFAAAERMRARSLGDMLASETPRVDPDLATDRQHLKELEDRIAVRQLRLRDGGAAPPELVKEQEEHESLRWRLQRSAPRTAAAFEPVRLAAIQSALPADTLFLEYSLGQPRSWVFVISATSAEAVPLPPARAIERDARELRSALSLPRTLDRSKLLQAAHRLHTTVLLPAVRKYPRHRRLAIAADGVLHSIPFGALLETSAPDLAWTEQPFAARRWEIRYVPSAQVWRSLAGRAATARGLLAYGGVPGSPAWSALPFSRAEVDALAGIYGRAARVRAGSAATEAAWRSDVAAGGFGVLHLSTHAVLNNRFPWFSGLVLASAKGANDSDGLLQGFEVARTPIPPALVVLSACETGLGRALDGEGLTGLTQAFLVAGASATVASLWRVEDRSAGMLMSSFHRRLANGATPAAALRAAGLELLRNPETAHPFYWAGFVLTAGPQ